MSAKTSLVYHNEEAARKHLEGLRWPNGPLCPHCGMVGGHYEFKGEKHRPGLWKCKRCRKQFSVTVGTVFERSKIPLHKWIYAAAILARSNSVSAEQIHRTIGVTYKSAWFMMRRLREARKLADAPFSASSSSS
jgi:transposase-like protein